MIALVPSSRIGFADVAAQEPAWTWAGKPLEPREPIPVERVEAVQYDDAGHAIGVPVPFLPAVPTNLTGGSERDDEAARRDLWPRILEALG